MKRSYVAKTDIEAQRKNRLRVSMADLVEGFRRVGLQQGDIIYCHSSLSKFAQVSSATGHVWHLPFVY